MTPTRWFDTTGLIQAFEVETRLFTALKEALDRQRAAVAANDPAALDTWTDGISRLLGEIETAEGNRQKVLLEVAGTAAPTTEALQTLIPEPLRPVVDRARRVFAAAARDAAREIAINRKVMARAIRTGDQLLRSILSPGPSAGYQPSGTSGSSILVNRTV